MGGLSLEVALALVCAVTFFRAGRFESAGEAHDSALWALMSVLLSALVVLGLKGSWVVLVVAQIGLFFGIGVYRAIRDPQ